VLRFHALGLPGIWAALWLWLAARAALLGRRWRAHIQAADLNCRPDPPPAYLDLAEMPPASCPSSLADRSRREE
jgi:hypothetical protein